MADDQSRDATAAPAAEAAAPRRAGVSRSVRRRAVVRRTTGRPATPARDARGAAAPVPDADGAPAHRGTTGPAGTGPVATLRSAAEPATPDPAETAGPADGAAPARHGPVSRRSTPSGVAGPRAWGVASAVLAVLLLAGLVGSGVAARAWWDRRQLDAAHQQALAAARQTTVNFMSISAASVDRDLKRISDGATGDFKDEFTRDTAQVKSAVTQNKVDSKATVLRAALVSGNRRHAVVLVAIDATVHNVAAPDGRLLHYRVRVDLTRDGRTGRWLASQLQFVG